MRTEAAHGGEPEEPAPLDAAGQLALVRTLALGRFPRERRTLEIFFEELGRRLAGADGDANDDGVIDADVVLPAGSFAELLTRLEELLEALLVGEAHGLARR
jgi:hypothetical protein